MSLEMVDYHGSYFAEVVAIPPNMRHGTPSGGTPFNNLAVDPMPRLLANMAVSLGYWRVEDLFKVHYDKGTPDELRYSVKPEQPSYRASTDWQRYGSFLDSISAGVKVLKGRTVFTFDPRSEKDVRHPNYRGSVGPGFTSQEIYFPTSPAEGVVLMPDGYSYGGNPLNYAWWSDGDAMYHNAFSNNTYFGTDNTAFNPLRRMRRMLVTPAADGFHFSMNAGCSLGPAFGAPGLAEYYSQYTYGDMHLFLKQFEDNPERVYRVAAQYGNGHPTYGLVLRVYISNVKVKWGDLSDLLTVTYNLRQESGYSLHWPLNPAAAHVWRDWEVKFSLSFTPSWPDRTHLQTNGGVPYLLTLPSVGTLYTTYGGKVVSEGYLNSQNFIFWSSRVPLNTSIFNTVSSGSAVNIQTLPMESEGRGSPILPSFSSFLKKGRNYGFASEIDRNMKDIRPSALLSTCDAVDSLLPSVDANLIEALSQIGSTLEVFPDFGGAIKSLSKLAAGRPLASLKDAMDVITDYQLKVKFNRDPNIDLLANQLPKIPQLIERCNNLRDGGLIISRGKFEHEFSNEFSRPSVSLVTRTKLVASLDSSSVLANILGVKAAGLLPAPSSMWDLIPFSFVVDWFLNIGDRFGDLENISLLALLDIRSFTHSYLFTSDLLDEELAMDGLKKFGLDRDDLTPQLWYYKREVSAFLPPLRHGRFDFRLPTRWPNWATAGSLGWQLLLG